jgi:trans-aconitate methyltransferase
MPGFDTSVPHSARVYDYWLGGKDNFAADREAGDHALEAYPAIVLAVRANRAFLARAVRFLAAECEVRQFLDIGTGIPTAGNTHEVAQAAAPESRIVYVDNDPIVLAHARALLTSTPLGACACVDADLRNPGAILAAAADTLSVLHLVTGDADAREIVGQLMYRCAPGSFLVISHPASDIDAGQTAEATRRLNQSGVAPAALRDREQVASLFAGLELVPPGLVRVPEWRPGSELEAETPGALWAGVARTS